MRTHSREQLITLVSETAKRDFGTDYVAFHFFSADQGLDEAFSALSSERSVTCGKPTHRQRTRLFCPSVQPASCALILLQDTGREFGVLALASRDADHFHPSKGLIFLIQLGQLISCRLLQQLDADADADDAPHEYSQDGRHRSP